jgi:hypothetical protein
VVHSSGVVEMCVRFCKCLGAAPEHEQLFMNRLFPSTFDRPETVFTFDVLDCYAIDSMECKTSAQSFFEKLRRLTNNAFPDEVPVRPPFIFPQSIKVLTDLQMKNRYQEMIRVNRQMRKLEVSKRFGLIYDESSSPGNFTIFCPACPQPGVNLPPGWKDLPKWLTRRTIAVDGNFHADHIKMRRPEADIMLSNGRGYMADDILYNKYLNVAKEPPLVGFH